jgi:hypothetical protein
MPKVIDLTHRVFDRLTVIRKLSTLQTNNIIKWECRCRCGSSKIVIGRTNQLTSGLLRSCGCLHIEIVRKIHISHGLSNDSLYGIWRSILFRCYNEKFQQYVDYGGRGITICDEWKNDFMAFYHDMGPRPSDKHSIDRKDNDKGYCKENCRWATAVEQANNRRNNLIYEFDGEIKTLAQWCREYSVNYRLVYRLITRCKMTFEDAIDEVLKKSHDKLLAIKECHVR